MDRDPRLLLLLFPTDIHHIFLLLPRLKYSLRHMHRHNLRLNVLFKLLLSCPFPSPP
ncbi:hypothetical protein A2U01_0023411 [Trifolium medium]|uniref:Uncharacterized protein n=1 Tax=Trifolium medium TaxID=97028 RepID=A0A392NTA2_9FABA|nr:hypothetical protein [Trifolium medium]